MRKSLGAGNAADGNRGNRLNEFLKGRCEVARHKDQDWNLPEGTKQPNGSRTHSWESVHTSLLMDIRDELKQLNKTLGCYRVQRMCDDVNRIDRRLQAHMPLTKGRRA